MKVKKNSILDQFYQFPNGYSSDKTDICTYVRGILGGILIAIVSVCFGVIFGVVLLYPYFIGIMTLITGVFIMEKFFVLTIGFQITLLILGIFVFLKTKYDKHRLKEYEMDIKKESVIRTYYKSIKEKTCFLVERV